MGAAKSFNRNLAEADISDFALPNSEVAGRVSLFSFSM